MNLLKAIEEITKCNDKQFIAKGRSGDSCIIKMMGEYDGYTDVVVIQYEDDEYNRMVDVLTINSFTISYDWEEVIQPITFKQALERCEKDGTSFVDYEYGIKLIKNSLGYVVTVCEDKVHNTNGDWYEDKRPF